MGEHMKIAAKLFFLSIFMFFATSALNADPLGQLCRKLEAGISGQQNKKVAVLGFPYHDGAVSKGSTIVQERLTTFLVEGKKVEVVERNLLDKVLGEMKLGGTGLIAPETAKQLGKVLGVSALVTGTLNDISADKTEINARMIFVETGQILSAGRASIKKTWTDVPRQTPVVKPVPRPSENNPLVQLAILLDTSNSMDGLIAQAKSQLWKVVNELAGSERDGKSPTVEVALYEYGNNRLSAGENYIRQVLPFSPDLDIVSEKLFGLTTRGGSEYCGAAIKDATDNLNWAKDDSVYKAVFIAGNEPFNQGPVNFVESAHAAVARGIVVNTIYCGPSDEGINGRWLKGATAGNGDYMSIATRTDVVAVRTPYDDEIARLGMLMNDTYIPLGSEGNVNYERQARVDKEATNSASAGSSVERAIFKSNKQYSRSARWDVTGQVADGKIKTDDIKKDELPENLRKLSKAEIDEYINKKIKDRKDLEAKISGLSAERRQYMEKLAKSSTGQMTLDKAMLGAVRSQASKKKLNFK